MAKYFSFGELTASATARQLGIGNTPPPPAAARLEELAARLLDPVRELWGGPLRVNSGYRSAELNAAVGGAASSQHMAGEAADITTGSRAGNRRLFRMIVVAGLEFDQLIDESGYAWLHISYRAGANRRQILHLGVRNATLSPTPHEGRSAGRRASRIMLAAVLLTAVFLAGHRCGVGSGGMPAVTTRVDTLVVRDTLRERVFVPVARQVVRVDTVWLAPAGRGDTAVNGDDTAADMSDTARLEVVVPIERKVYRTDDYRAVVEGFRPALVELELYPKTTLVTRETTLSPPQKRWSVGLQTGWGLTPHGPAPYFGVGVQYRVFFK
jgi:hypothetical protein